MISYISHNCDLATTRKLTWFTILPTLWSRNNTYHPRWGMVWSCFTTVSIDLFVFGHPRVSKRESNQSSSCKQKTSGIPCIDFPFWWRRTLCMDAPVAQAWKCIFIFVQGFEIPMDFRENPSHLGKITKFHGRRHYFLCKVSKKFSF